ncbi:hypothetical protein ACSS6W_009019 [Trichoderma asperelloides]
MLLLYATIFVASLAEATAGALSANNTQFDWATIEPTEDLRYHDCFNGLRCARLKVPLDWNNLKDNRTVAIAIATLPASVPVDHPDYGGTIILNPGGPGDPGVNLVRLSGRHLQKVIDNNKKYEYLGFDPRGLGSSTPQVDCFGGDKLARNANQQVLRGLGPVDSSEDALRRFLTLSKGLGAVCENTLGKTNILEHVTTAAVCRDMVEIVDRVDELRKKETALLKRSKGEDEHDASSEGNQVARIQYLGFSYGTLLGNTFASMFPGRVGRMVLDGVIYAEDYMQGLWHHNLDDTEAVVNYFYDTCYNAGDSCPLRTSEDVNGASIRRRVDKLITDLDATPVYNAQGTSIAAVTGRDIRDSISQALYRPILGFPPLAQMISDAFEGNFTLIADTVTPDDIQSDCAAGSQVFSGEAAYAVVCSDAASKQTKHDLAYYSNEVEKFLNQSITFGAKWATIPLQCVGYRLQPNYQFHGPWVTPPADSSLKPGVPAAPLLFLTNKIDPVTPPVNAKAMSAGHPGSAVVIQDSVGHCAIPAGWSDCTNQILRDYFEFGTVPQNGTFCTASCKPWQGNDKGCDLLSFENNGGW